MKPSTLNVLRVVLFGAVLALAAIGIAGAIGGDGGDTRSPAELRAAADRAHRVTEARADKARNRGRRGPRGRRGRTGATGPRGPAGVDGTDEVVDLSVNWRGSANASGRDTAAAAIAGIGTLQLTCNAGNQALALVPAQSGPRTVMTLTTFQGAGTYDNALNNRYESQSAASPISVPLPVNGMIAGTLSVELVSGAGGPGATPATLNLTSYIKTNDPDPSANYCFVSGQVITKG